MDERIFPRWMTKLLGILLIIFLIFLILNQVNNYMGYPMTLRVSAQGKVSAIPDTATITVGVTSQGTTPVDTKNANNQKINQVIAFIKQQGVESEDITTSQFNSSPRYNYANGQSTIAGYQADQSVTVLIHKIDKSQSQLETILDGVVNAGANQVQGVNFSFSDPDKLQIEARKIAIKNAKEKAHELADETDLRLGRIININPHENSMPMPYSPMNLALKAAPSVSPTIEPGKQEVVENIDLIFEVY